MNKITKRLIALTLAIITLISGSVIFAKNEPEDAVVTVLTNETKSSYPVAGISRTISTVIKESGDYSIKPNENIIVKTAYSSDEETTSVEDETVIEAYEESPEFILQDFSAEFYVIAKSGLNVRMDPNTDSEILEKLPFAKKIKVMEKVVYEDGNIWYKLDGELGYVCGEYVDVDSPVRLLGNYLLTYYCPCAKCCDVETGITASGARTVEGVTIAAPKEIPFGTKLLVDGHTYIVQDRGGAIKGNRLDIFVNTHESALNDHSPHYADVYVVEE